MPLMYANTKDIKKIHHVTGDPAMKKHLFDLGFVPGASIKVIAHVAGNVIVQVQEARIALNREMAMKIMVTD